MYCGDMGIGIGIGINGDWFFFWFNATGIQRTTRVEVEVWQAATRLRLAGCDVKFEESWEAKCCLAFPPVSIVLESRVCGIVLW